MHPLNVKQISVAATLGIGCLSIRPRLQLNIDKAREKEKDSQVPERLTAVFTAGQEKSLKCCNMQNLNYMIC